MRLSRMLAAVACVSLAQSAVGQDAGLAQGIQQVREGDFEAAVVTLEEVALRLEGDAGRRLEAAQARLQLGIARVALTQLDAAREAFKAALGHDPSLRIGEDRFSPKVVRVFESVRQELATQAAPAKKGGAKAPLLVVGALAAVGGGVALAAGGGGAGSSPPPPTPSFTNARFATPVILCPNGNVNTPLPFTVLIDANNAGDVALSIRSVTVRMTIVESPDVPSEVGQSTTQPGSPLPDTIAARSSVTVQIGSALLCTNLPGGVSRYNDWTALVTLETSAGTFNLGTADRLRVNLP